MSITVICSRTGIACIRPYCVECPIAKQWVHLVEEQNGAAPQARIEPAGTVPKRDQGQTQPAVAAPPDVGEMVKKLQDIADSEYYRDLIGTEVHNLFGQAVALLSQPKPEPEGVAAEIAREIGLVAKGGREAAQAWAHNLVGDFSLIESKAALLLQALSSQNVGAGEVVVEKNDLRNFGEALLCAEYAITNPRSDQQFALVAVRSALADLNAAAIRAKQVKP